MDGVVMSFGLAAGENKKLKAICSGLGLRLRKVQTDEYTQPIGSFAGVRSKVETAPGMEPLEAQMLVFAFVSDRQLDAALSAMRTARIAADAYKAVLTETNSRWNAYQLFEQLRQERDALHQQG